MLGIVLLQAIAATSIVGFFLRHREGESVWASLVAPALGAVGLVVGLVLMVRNYPTLTGSDATWVNALPVLLVVAAVLGVLRPGGTGQAA